MQLELGLLQERNEKRGEGESERRREGRAEKQRRDRREERKRRKKKKRKKRRCSGGVQYGKRWMRASRKRSGGVDWIVERCCNCCSGWS
jgi:hypothetical protein